jgi:hypothetical protein
VSEPAVSATSTAPLPSIATLSTWSVCTVLEYALAQSVSPLGSSLTTKAESRAKPASVPLPKSTFPANEPPTTMLPDVSRFRRPNRSPMATRDRRGR